MSDPIKSVWGEQDSYGIDISLLRDNLKLTPDQRWDQHEQARKFLIACMESAENARLSRSPEVAQ